MEQAETIEVEEEAASAEVYCEISGQDTSGADPCLQRLVTLFPDYFNKIQEMLASPYEWYSQRGRHLLQLGKWAVIDAALAETPVTIGGVDFREAGN